MLLTNITSPNLIILKTPREEHAKSSNRTSLHSNEGEGVVNQHEHNLNFGEQKVPEIQMMLTENGLF